MGNDAGQFAEAGDAKAITQLDKNADEPSPIQEANQNVTSSSAILEQTGDIFMISGGNEDLIQMNLQEDMNIPIEEPAVNTSQPRIYFDRQAEFVRNQVQSQKKVAKEDKNHLTKKSKTSKKGNEKSFSASMMDFFSSFTGTQTKPKKKPVHPIEFDPQQKIFKTENFKGDEMSLKDLKAHKGRVDQLVNHFEK